MRRLFSWPSPLLSLVLFTLIYLAASASVYEITITDVSSIVQSPSVVLQQGNIGSSSISQLGSSATTSITAGLVFYENANMPTSQTPLIVDTTFAVPSSSGSFAINRGSTGYLWSPQYTVATTLYAGDWILDLWAGAKKAGSMYVTIQTVNSTGAIISTIVNNQPTATIPQSNVANEVITTFHGSSGIVPANGYIRLAITAPTGPSNPQSFKIFWGNGHPTNFRSPSTYNYILKVYNPTSSTWHINLGLITTTDSTRLTNLTVWFNSTSVSKQISIGSAVSTMITTGSPISLAPSSTVYIAVNATASSFGVSTLTIYLLLNSSNGPYSIYGITLNVG
ncbi:MAG: hypothetical protein QXG05_04555 [Nitrososphaerota archaeon]